MNPLKKLQKLKPKKSKKAPKPVKKGTTRRNIKAWWTRLDRRQQRGDYAVERSSDVCLCRHCGTEFEGRYCPQCGLPGEWEHFTFKRLVLNFLDIWGLGNRPMFRTIRDLFWRPGYMIRDYLAGHHLSYFPPFKMLAVTTLLVVFVAWAFNLTPEPKAELASVLRSIGEHKPLSSVSMSIINLIEKFELFMDENALYNALAKNVLLVFAVWLAFRKRSHFNLVETFFSLIYINCQFQLLTLVYFLFTWRMGAPGLFPYAVPADMVLLVLMYDFKQLYGLPKWRNAFWGIVRTSIYMCFLIAVLFALIFLPFVSTSFDLDLNFG